MDPPPSEYLILRIFKNTVTIGASTLRDEAVNQSLQRFKAEFFKALAHPTRIRILELLRNGEKSVGELQQEIAREGSTVSQQLAILRMKNVVDTRRVGNVIYYRLRDSRSTMSSTSGDESSTVT